MAATPKPAWPALTADRRREVAALVVLPALVRGAGPMLLLGALSVPFGAHLSVTERSIVVDSNGAVLSTATLCPEYEFDQLGIGGPHLSPDQHWILVDLKGPYTPGNVPRRRALVSVANGRIVAAPDFPTYLGVANTADSLMWASGERATLRYKDGRTAAVHDPPLRPIPAQPCPRPTPG